MSDPSSGWLTRDEMIEVDRVMVEELGIELIQMMEIAGLRLAQLAIERYRPPKVVVCVGSGGNGGGGMVAARHLANRGVGVELVCTCRPPQQLAGVPRHQFDILDRMGIVVSDSVNDADLVIDAVIGYSLAGAPHGRSADLIAEINDSPALVLALDLPSGIDATGGQAPGSSVDANATLTLAAPKIGLRTAPGVGDLFLADISVPAAVIERLGHRSPDFSTAPIIGIAG